MNRRRAHYRNLAALLLLSAGAGVLGWAARAGSADNRQNGSSRATPRPARTDSSGGSLADRVAAGRAIFQGKGSCTVCHTIGGPTTAKSRGPDLAGIGARAAQRAQQFGLLGPHAATQYLVRSIIRPADDVLEGFNPAPESWLPAGLSDEEIRQVVLYLQSLGGRPDPASIRLPADWLSAKRREYQRELQLFSLGDPLRGKALFHDPKGNAGCIKCHTIDGVGKQTCPDLTAVYRVQRPSYILESILDSSARIVRGYRQVIILDADGRVHTGLPVNEDDRTITLVIDQEGRTEAVQKEDIDEQDLSKVSIMPGGFGRQLTAQQLMDVVAYVLHHADMVDSKAAGPGQLASRSTQPPAALPSPSLDVFGPVTEDQQRYRMAIERGDPAVGARIYRHYCIMCHGPKGDGTGFNAENLATKPANHTDNRRMSKTEDLLLHGVITRGGMKTGRSFLMPPWGGTLSDRDRWDLVAHIRTLHAQMKP